MNETATSDTAPSTQNTLAWPGQEGIIGAVANIDPITFDELRTELQDNPRLRLETLPRDELRRLSIRFLGIVHEPSSAAAIGRSIGTPGYYLRENILSRDTLAQYGDRSSYDLRTNVLMRGGTLGVSSVTDPGGQALHEFIDASSLSPELRQHTDSSVRTPIYRSIDVNASDSPPDQPDISYEALSQGLRLMRIAFHQDLYTAPSSEQRAALRQFMAARRQYIASREAVDQEQISIIAANALTRHPDQPIDITVATGTVHIDVLADYFKGLGVERSTLAYAPGHAEQIAARHNRLLRPRADNGAPTDEDLNRLLLGIAIVDLKRGMHGEANGYDMLLVDERATRYVDSLESGVVAEYIARTDDIKGAKQGLLSMFVGQDAKEWRRVERIQARLRELPDIDKALATT